MATWVYPAIAPDQLRVKEDESLAKETEWLLESLQESLAALKEGLEECVALLAPREPGSTLVLSSQRSENVKGFVTRVGTKLVKGDITLRLPSLPPNIPRGTPTYPSTHHTIHPSPPSSSTTPPDITLPPLLSLANSLSAALDVIDVTRWTGRSTSAPFIQGQLTLLSTHLATARRCLRGPSPLADVAEQQQQQQVGNSAGEEDGSGGVGRDDHEEWWTASVAPGLFEPPLHPNLALHFSIFDAALVLTVRTVAPVDPDDRSAGSSGTGTPSGSGTGDFSLSGFNLREKLFGLALGHGAGSSSGRAGPGQHDEVGERFLWRGKREVGVREKVRVESSGDPSLISVAAKLSALEHEVRRWRGTLAVLMGEDEGDEY